MLNEDTEKVLKDSENLFKRAERINKFITKYRISPSLEAKRLGEEMQKV